MWGTQWGQGSGIMERGRVVRRSWRREEEEDDRARSPRTMEDDGGRGRERGALEQAEHWVVYKQFPEKNMFIKSVSWPATGQR